MDGFEVILSSVHQSIDNLNSRMAITSFTGLRAISSTHDFVINYNEGFINAAGISSPGLSAAPAIAVYIKNLLIENGAVLVPNENYIKTRKSMSYFKEASFEEKNEIIKKDKSFGRIICRCETVTEGEILEAIRTNPRPTDLDGIKRRCRAQMGRCQGGFCMPYIVELLAKENNIRIEDVTKCGEGSNLIISKTKEVA
jgi:glycerol-3-phosphate dehydrogenase